MSEYNHIVEFYGNNPTMGFTTFNTLSAEDKNRIKRMLNNLKSFEAPDMYSKIDNDVYIIEHFEFDASKRNRKGMSGIKEENALKQRISEKTEENYIIDQVHYNVDKQSFQKNFEGVFDHHYKKIDKYIENLKNQGILCDSDRVHVGFFAENIYPPLYEKWQNGEPHFVGELLYFLTRQFYDFIQKKERLEFMFFGCIYNQNPQLFYIKPSDKGKNLIDLEDNSVVFSKMNGNEFTFAYSL